MKSIAGATLVRLTVTVYSLNPPSLSAIRALMTLAAGPSARMAAGMATVEEPESTRSYTPPLSQSSLYLKLLLVSVFGGSAGLVLETLCDAPSGAVLLLFGA